MLRKQSLPLVLVIGMAALLALAAPSLAQTSSDCPGGGSHLRPVTGADELAGAPSWQAVWDAIGLALQQRLPFAVLSGSPVGAERVQSYGASQTFVVPRRVVLEAGGFRSRP